MEGNNMNRIHRSEVMATTETGWCRPVSFRWIATSSSVVLALLLSACGGGEDEGTSVSDLDPSQPVSEEQLDSISEPAMYHPSGHLLPLQPIAETAPSLVRELNGEDTGSISNISGNDELFVYIVRGLDGTRTVHVDSAVDGTELWTKDVGISTDLGNDSYAYASLLEDTIIVTVTDVDYPESSTQVATSDITSTINMTAYDFEGTEKFVVEEFTTPGMPSPNIPSGMGNDLIVMRSEVGVTTIDGSNGTILSEFDHDLRLFGGTEALYHNDTKLQVVDLMTGETVETIVVSSGELHYATVNSGHVAFHIGEGLTIYNRNTDESVDISLAGPAANQSGSVRMVGPNTAFAMLLTFDSDLNSGGEKAPEVVSGVGVAFSGDGTRLWQTDLTGFGGSFVGGEEPFILTYNEPQVVALSTESGTELWSTEIGDDFRIVTYGTNGMLIEIEHEDGDSTTTELVAVGEDHSTEMWSLSFETNVTGWLRHSSSGGFVYDISPLYQFFN